MSYLRSDNGFDNMRPIITISRYYERFESPNCFIGPDLGTLRMLRALDVNCSLLACIYDDVELALFSSDILRAVGELNNT